MQTFANTGVIAVETCNVPPHYPTVPLRTQYDFASRIMPCSQRRQRTLVSGVIAESWRGAVRAGLRCSTV